MRKKIDSIKTQLIKDSLLLTLNQVLIRSLSDSVKSLTENKLLVIDSITNDTDAHIIQVFGKRKYGFWEKVGLVLGSIFSRHVFGFLITALALSLGAPFWFDLLNKLASIRGVGVKPEEKKQTVDDIPKPLNLVVPQVLINSSLVVNDIIDQALQIYASAIKSIPGVKSVFRVKDDIQVNVDNHSTQAFVLKQFPNITVNEVQIILKIVVSGIPKSQQSKRNAGEIYNANMPNFSGTLGCIIENSQTKSKHILSCWHVMKGNLNYDHDDNDTAINDYQGKEIGIRWAGGIDGAYDFAFAQLTPERVKENNSILFAKLNITNCKIKPLSNADINNQIAVKYFDCIYNESVQLGKIYTDTTSIDIEYKDKTRTLKDILILINNNSSGTQKPISDHGNSGSIVFDVKDGNAIAMIIAGDDYHTYAIKLANISSIYPEMKILN